MSRSITVVHNGKTYEGRLMKIKSTHLGYESHGVFSAYLTVSAEHYTTSIGGYFLDEYVEGVGTRKGTAFGMDQIIQIVNTMKVDRWEDLVGKEVLVLFEASVPRGIAHPLVESKVLVFQDHAEEWFKPVSA